MPHRYYYANGGAHPGLWIAMIVAFLVFLGFLLYIVVNLSRHDVGPYAVVPKQSPGTVASDPLRILEERLARADIDVDEYTRRKGLLRDSSPAKT